MRPLHAPMSKVLSSTSTAGRLSREAVGRPPAVAEGVDVAAAPALTAVEGVDEAAEEAA